MPGLVCPRTTCPNITEFPACVTRGRARLVALRYAFQYASPRLWNQLPAPLRQPRTNLSNSASPSCMSGISSIGSIDSPLSSSITPFLHSSTPGLKLPFLQILPTIAYHFFSWTDSMDSPDCLPILLSISVFFSLLFLFSTVSFPRCRLILLM